MTMRKYEPTERDREIVLRMAAVPGITHEDLAFLIINERTGRKISAKTLRKHFAEELSRGMTVMKQITMDSFVEQIRNHVWPATKMALQNYCGLKDTGEGITVQTNQNLTWKIVGIDPPPVEDDPAPVGNIVDLLADKNPLRRLPSIDAVPPSWEPAPPKQQPEPVVRTEMDLPVCARPGNNCGQGSRWVMR